MKNLLTQKEKLENQVNLYEELLATEEEKISDLRDMIEREKIEIKYLEEQIEEQIEKEKGAWVPDVFDPKSYIEAGRWNDASYGIPDLVKGTGYKGRIHAVRNPQINRLESVWNCDHPAAKQWCRNTLAEKIDTLKKEILKIERMYAKYTE